MLITYKCTKCGKINTVEVDDTINLTGNQELLKTILDNSKFNFKCVDCNTEHNVIYDVLFQDDNEKFYVKINSSNELLTLVSKDDYKIRIVKDLNEANEKLRTFYYRLDDRVIEIIKYMIKDDLEKNNESLKVNEIYFFRYAQGYLEFVIFNKEAYLGIMKFSLAGYKEVKHKHKDNFDNNIQIVNENFVLNILSKPNKNNCA